MENLMALIHLAIAALCFYLMSVAVADYKVRQEHPWLSGFVIKTSITGIFVSQVGFVILPDDTYYTAFISTLSVFGILASTVWRYRKTYLNMEIAFVSGTTVMSFPNDRYEEVAPGVFCRNYVFDGVVVAGWELELIEIAGHYDRRRWDCIFFDIGRHKDTFDPDTPDFPIHKHRGRERTHLVKGKAVIMVGAPDLTPELPFTVPPKTTHYFNSKGHCLGASFVERV